MLFLRRAFCNSLQRQTTISNRALQTCHVLRTGIDTSGTAPKTRKKRIVTRKKYSELPEPVAVVGAPPLEEWHGGLANVSSTDVPASSIPEKVDASSSGHDTEYGGNNLQNPLESARTREHGSKDDTAKVNLPAKPRRRRRRATESTSTELTDPNLSVRQPKNPLATEILENLRRFPHCILLTRVGQFYESYFDQAREVSRLLNIKLTQRLWDGQRILMCGFPLMHLDKYLKILVQSQKRFVALCEEFPRNPHLGVKAGFDRRVVRIVTPGTLIDEPFLNPYENNYLLAITRPRPTSDPVDEAAHVGLAWIDVSTGEFFTKTASSEGLRDELVRIGPREVVLSYEEKDGSLNSIVAEEGHFWTPFASPTDAEPATSISEGDEGTDDVTSNMDATSASEPTLNEAEIRAISLLTAFMRTNMLEHMPQLSSPSRETIAGRMQIDAHTIRALEIREKLSDGGVSGSLLNVIKRTVTSSGTRLLARWLCSPSTSLREINARQSLVAFFHARPYLREDLIQTLSDIEDATRIVQRLMLGRGHASDLSAICSTVRTWMRIQKRIELERDVEQQKGMVDEEDWSSIDALMRRMHDLKHLADMIESAVTASGRACGVEENQPSDSEESVTDSLSSGTNSRSALGIEFWTISPSFSKQLASLHASLQGLHERARRLELRLQLEYNAPSLSLRSSPGYGMHVHISRGKRDSARLKASDLFIPISQSNTTNTFFFQEWSKLGAQIMDTVTAIYAAEKESFEALRNDVNAHVGHLRRNARILDELDVTLAFANLAVEMNFVRPTVTEDSAYHVTNGRHPTVELGLLTSGRVFTPNSVSFTPDSRLHIITGPNMAGKSTFLRQTALIAILAQSGSFVPADAARIGVVDRVFSRIGAKDDLFRDRSTFMVEMLETSEILRRATPNSLVIMDEVGRGTTVDDGVAIAFAAVHHLLSVNGCRALFATHFHELADMLGCDSDHRGQGSFDAVSFFCKALGRTIASNSHV